MHFMMQCIILHYFAHILHQANEVIVFVIEMVDLQSSCNVIDPNPFFLKAVESSLTFITLGVPFQASLVLSGS